jgi:hypothetical protein
MKAGGGSVRLFKTRKSQLAAGYCETCGEICDATCAAERRLEQIKTNVQLQWGARVGR